MSHVRVMPEVMTAAAAGLASIGTAVEDAHRTAGTSILTIAPAAADEVSAGIARLFSQHAQHYRAAAQGAAAFQQHFVQNLTASASSYASAEDVIASLLQPLDSEVRYYQDAAIALISMVAWYPITQVAAIFFPLLDICSVSAIPFSNNC